MKPEKLPKRRLDNILYLQKSLREKGINLDFETTKKLYGEIFNELPKLRANELPFRGRFKRLEIFGIDDYGKKFIIEGGNMELIRRKRKKSKYREILKIPFRHGNLRISKGEKAFFIGYAGGGHFDFAFLTLPVVDAFITVFKNIKKQISEDMRRKTGTSTSTKYLSTKYLSTKEEKREA